VKRGSIIVILFLLMLLGALWLKRNGTGSTPRSAVGLQPEERSESSSTTVAQTPVAGGTEGAMLGATILRDYGRSELPPENDLTLMSRLMENALLLLKSAGNRPLSANEDWAALFRGENAAHERFLPEQHAALDRQGRLIDRWGAPLFFHALGSGRYELRSAGPDKKLWTADDIHRNPDGSFRGAVDLNPVSLFQR
jgi:hypothetical protein